MTATYLKSAYSLQQFAQELRQKITSARFEGVTAAHYWRSMQQLALESVDDLESAVYGIGFLDSEKQALFDDSLFLSRELLEWAEESGDELSYADALAEAGHSLLERLRYTEVYSQAHLLRGSQPHATAVGQVRPSDSTKGLLDMFTESNLAPIGIISKHVGQRSALWDEPAAPRPDILRPPPIPRISSTPAQCWGLLFDL